MTSGRSTFGELHPPLQLAHTGIGFPPALQRGIAEPVATQDHQNPRRIPQRRGGAEVAVSRTAAGHEEGDHADTSRAGSTQSLHDSVAGADAGPGENYAMNAHSTSTEMGRGRGTALFPGTPFPKT